VNESELKKYFIKDLGWGWFRDYQSRKVFEFLVEASRFCENGVVLDAGAGHQRYRPFFDDSLYLSQEHEDGIKFKDMKNIQYDLLNPIDVKIPLKNDCIDGVLSTSVIEHLTRPDIFCNEAHRVLRPGGKLFINVPFSIIEHETPYDYNRPTRYALQKWLNDAGFKDIIINPSSSCTDTVCNVLPIAVYCDILKTNEGYQKNFVRVYRSSANPVIKLLEYIRILVAGAAYAVTKILCGILKLLVDRGPYDKALLPVGWIVVASKRGKHFRSKGQPRREEFLKKYKI